MALTRPEPRSLWLVLLAWLALPCLALPAQGQVDVARFQDPAIQALVRLNESEAWEQAIQQGEVLAARLEAQGDRTGVYFAYQQIWLACFNLGDVTGASRANARSKHAWYLLTRDDPGMADHALVAYASALVSDGRGAEAVRLVDDALRSLPPTCELRDMLLWQRAMALHARGEGARAIASLVADAGLQRRQVAEDPQRAALHRFVAGSEWLLAAELAEAASLCREEARSWGRAALEAFAPLVAEDGRVTAGSRGDATLLVRARAAAGEYDAALSCFAQLGYAAQSPYLQRLRYQGNALRGWYEDQAGHAEAAIRCYQACLQALACTWSRLRLESNKETLLAQGHPFYVPRPLRVCERLIHLLLERGRVAESLEVAELFKARAFVDLLGRRASSMPSKAADHLLVQERRLRLQLERAQSRAGMAVSPEAAGRLERLASAYAEVAEQVRQQDDEYADQVLPRHASAATFQSALEPGCLLLEYFVGEQEVFGWAVTRGSLVGKALPARPAGLDGAIQGVRRAVGQPGSPAQARHALRALSSLLVEPLLDGSAGPTPWRNLIVVPHGALHHIPFGALTDATGKYLIERFPVVNLPTASSLRFCTRKNPRRKERFDLLGASGVAFALGSVTPPSGAWVPLPGTVAEARAITRLLPRTVVVEGSGMNVAAVRAAVPSAGIVHFATHGAFDADNPLASCIVLSDGTLPVTDIFSLRLHAYSVVLSACETGLGRVRSGDDIVGLTRAFLYAGTPAVMATLWKIADAPTVSFMAEFYRRLRTEDRAAALRGAQRAALGCASTAHPYYWAGFVVTGDWR